MAIMRYLSHPQVVIDPDVPVAEWGLNDIGRARVAALVEAGWLAGTSIIVSSIERKAIETAEPIAAALGVRVEVREAMGENDRTATGYLPEAEFQRVADAFFANPQESIRGWERAVDAQARVVAEIEAVLARDVDGDVLLVGHGAVGTLAYCHYAGLAISREHDQPPGGGGNFWVMQRDERRVQHGWRAMETIKVG